MDTRYYLFSFVKRLKGTQEFGIVCFCASRVASIGDAIRAVDRYTDDPTIIIPINLWEISEDDYDKYS
jgi:hypothetical protein